MTFYAIGNSIMSILTSVQSAPGSLLQSVYNYEIPAAGTGYPYATLTPGEMQEDVLDTAWNQATYKYVVRVNDLNEDKADMEQTMRQLADTIMAGLRTSANQTFGGTVDKVLPFMVTWGWETGNTAPIRYFEITITVVKEFSI